MEDINSSNRNVRIKFLGAAGTVTGSKHLLETPEKKILIDCGLFQGLKSLRLLNREPLAIEPALISDVIITHAHLDHTGYLPLLVRNGYKGKIYMTAPTRELAEIILRDSAKIQEEDAARANEGGFSRHHPSLPLYTVKDAENAFRLFEVIPGNQWHSLSPDITFRFQKNGHILGSAFVELECYGKRIIFSGDIGKKNMLTMADPLQPEKADFLIMESTYGDRLHTETSPADAFTEIIHDTIRRQGNILIPAFAVGRSQEVMMMMNILRRSNMIPLLPVYLDTPMGTDATAALCNFPEWHKLNRNECMHLCDDIIKVKSTADTYAVINKAGSKIIIAASGMLTGGRVLHYLKSYVTDKRNTILLAGYQTEGTRGRALRSGAHEVKVFGKYYPVKARIKEIEGLSAHGDQREMLDWMKGIKNKPGKVFLVHGEPQSLQAFRVKIWDELGWYATVPQMNEEFELFDIPADASPGKAHSETQAAGH